MRKFLFAILCTLSLTANAIVIKKDFPELLGQQVGQTDLDTLSPYFSFDFSDTGIFDLRHAVIFFDIDENEYADYSPVQFISQYSGIVGSVVDGIYRDGGIYFVLKEVGINQQNALGLPWPEDDWDIGIGAYSGDNRLVRWTIGSGSFVAISNEFAAITDYGVPVDEPPTALIAALMLGLLVYRGNRLNR